MDNQISRYAALLCDIGVRVEPGQDVAVNAQIEHAALARAVADHAYARGARYVDIWYWDPFAKRSRLRHAPTETLSWTPGWLDTRYERLAETRGALVNIVGDPHPRLLSGLDEHRCGLDRMPALASRLHVQTRGLVAWTFGCCPTEAWAQSLYGEPDAARLWDELAACLRLDTGDPVTAWNDHLHGLRRRAAQLSAWAFDTIHYRGPGTDLTAGLIPGSTWEISELDGPRGTPNLLNLPTEEVYTTPDWRHAEGTVTSTLPLAIAGTVAEPFTLTIEDGEIVHVSGGVGSDVIRAQMRTDAGARRLGELALVDGTSAVGRSGTVFLETLLDENARSHIAWGAGIPSVFPNWRELSAADLAARGVNQSQVHTDFMIGGPGLSITGTTAAGEQAVIIAADTWILRDR